MSLVVNETSYISVADADTYMDNNYVSTSTEYTTWDGLTDANKEIYLKKATKRIDRQILRGIKAVDTQTLEFPRAIKTYGNYYDTPVYGVNPGRFNDVVVETEVSQRVIDANVEEALSNSLVDAGTSSNGSERTKLQAQGVKSFTLGDLSETYGTGLSSSYNSTVLLSSEAKELLRYYIAGGVPIA